MKTTVFFSNYSFHPQFTATPLATKMKVCNDKVEAFVKTMQLMQQVYHRNLATL
jgi:hypothetical protein